MAHAPLSPSESHRWMNCAGSPTLIKSKPRPDSGEAAELGTAVHALAAHRISRFDIRPDWVSYEWNKVKKAMRVTDDMWWSAGRMAKRALIAMYRHFPEEVKWGIEKRVHVTGNVWGTADFYVWSPESRHLIIVDFKNGRVPVPIKYGNEPNPQLMCYGIGALELIKGPVSDVSVTIEVSQPNSRDGQYIKTMHMSAKEAYEWKDYKLLPAEEKALDPNAKRTAGDWCEYCPAKDDCPEVKEAIQVHAGMVFAAHVQSLTVPRGEQLAQVLRWKPVMKQFFADVDAVALKEMEEGLIIPGFKLVRGREANRAWPEWIKDPEDLAVALCLDTEDVIERKLKTPAAIDKIGGRANLLATRAKGKLSVVPEEDIQEQETGGQVEWPTG